MLYQQIECQDVYSATAIIWVEAQRVKAGDAVTFKETGDKEWLVRKVYPHTSEGHNRGWGLNLPKSQRTER